MPQMSPLIWLILMLIFSMLMYFMILNSYFIFKYKMLNNKKNLMKLNKFNMKW